MKEKETFLLCGKGNVNILSRSRMSRMLLWST